MMEFKRNTDNVIPVRLTGVNMEDITSISFAFKATNDESSDCIIEKEYVYDENPDAFTKIDDTSFICEVYLSAEDTMKIPRGIFYMDVQPVSDGEKLNAGRPQKLKMNGTFFEEDSND